MTSNAPDNYQLIMRLRTLCTVMGNASCLHIQNILGTIINLSNPGKLIQRELTLESPVVTVIKGNGMKPPLALNKYLLILDACSEGYSN